MQKPMTTPPPPPPPPTGAAANSNRPAARSLWIAVALAFGLMIAAWCVLFIIASRNRVQEVPLPAPQTNR